VLDQAIVDQTLRILEATKDWIPEDITAARHELTRALLVAAISQVTPRTLLMTPEAKA
jgi:hypothetical protein